MVTAIVVVAILVLIGAGVWLLTKQAAQQREEVPDHHFADPPEAVAERGDRVPEAPELPWTTDGPDPRTPVEPPPAAAPAAVPTAPFAGTDRPHEDQDDQENHRSGSHRADA